MTELDEAVERLEEDIRIQAHGAGDDGAVVLVYTDDLRTLLSAYKRQREIIERLPKTKDGVPKTLGDSVWYPRNLYDEPHQPTEGFVVMADDDCSKWAVQAWLPGRRADLTTMRMLGVGDCYSTREAALQGERQ